MKSPPAPASGTAASAGLQLAPAVRRPGTPQERVAARRKSRFRRYLESPSWPGAEAR